MPKTTKRPTKPKANTQAQTAIFDLMEWMDRCNRVFSIGVILLVLIAILSNLGSDDSNAIFSSGPDMALLMSVCILYLAPFVWALLLYLPFFIRLGRRIDKLPTNQRPSHKEVYAQMNPSMRLWRMAFLIVFGIAVLASVYGFLQDVMYRF